MYAYILHVYVCMRTYYMCMYVRVYTHLSYLIYLVISLPFVNYSFVKHCNVIMPTPASE